LLFLFLKVLIANRLLLVRQTNSLLKISDVDENGRRIPHPLRLLRLALLLRMSLIGPRFLIAVGGCPHGWLVLLAKKS
jgi:hypothetical protein